MLKGPVRFVRSVASHSASESSATVLPRTLTPLRCEIAIGEIREADGIARAREREDDRAADAGFTAGDERDAAGHPMSGRA